MAEGLDEIDGPMLWDFIKRRVKPSTKVGAAKLKSKIEKAKLSEHNDNVIEFNTWFEDTRKSIIAEEGTGYNEYTRMLFQSYLHSNNAEFKVAIKEEERRWIQDKLPNYTHNDLIELGRVTFNNLVKSNVKTGVCLTVGENVKDWGTGVNYKRYSFAPRADDYSRFVVQGCK